MSRQSVLPISGKEVPDRPAWLYQGGFLTEAGARSARTESTYRSGLRTFADWLQHYSRDGFDKETEWPLVPDQLTTATVLNFRTWLLDNRSRSTATTYLAAVLGYLNYLDGQNACPEGVQLGKLQRQLRRRRVDQNQAATVIDLDQARQAMPQIVAYYDNLPLPAENDRYNRRLSLLRNRALVTTLYSTAARISESVRLDRGNVRNGQAEFATVVGKGGKARTLHLRGYARQAIRAYLSERLDSNPALFVAHSRNRRNARLSITAAHNVVKRAVRALNLPDALSAHDFRHYRATQLLREGMPIEVVQEYLGHADISTTRNIYAPVLGVQVVTEWLDNLDIPPEEAARREEDANETFD